MQGGCFSYCPAGCRDLTGPVGELKFGTFQNARFSSSGSPIWAREWVGLLGHDVPSCPIVFLHVFHLITHQPLGECSLCAAPPSRIQVLPLGAQSQVQPSQAILGRRGISGPFGEFQFRTFQNTRSSLLWGLIRAREWVGLLGHFVPSCPVSRVFTNSSLGA